MPLQPGEHYSWFSTKTKTATESQVWDEEMLLNKTVSQLLKKMFKSKLQLI